MLERYASLLSGLRAETNCRFLDILQYPDDQDGASSLVKTEGLLDASGLHEWLNKVCLLSFDTKVLLLDVCLF